MASYFMDDEAKKLAGFGQFKDAEEVKDFIVGLACSVAGIKNPTSKTRDALLAIGYDIPYEAESSEERVTNHLRFLFHATWAFNRSNSVQTIVQSDQCFHGVTTLIKMSIESMQDCLNQIEAAKSSFDKRAAKEKADKE